MHERWKNTRYELCSEVWYDEARDMVCVKVRMSKHTQGGGFLDKKGFIINIPSEQMERLPSVAPAALYPTASVLLPQAQQPEEEGDEEQ